MMRRMYVRTNSESQTTTWVGRGRSAPRSLNILVKVGMTKVSMKITTRKATLMMLAG